MKKLTAKQDALLTEIKEKLDQNGLQRVHVYHYSKHEWHSKGMHEGMPLVELEQLEKKGKIKITRESSRLTGQYNPKEESYGYSTFILDVTVHLVTEISDSDLAAINSL